MTANSPLIKDITWGAVNVEGLGGFRDVKLYPGGGREWDWSETGTHHDPGIQIADVNELLLNGAKIIVLSKGMWQRLKTAPETLEYLKAKNIPVYIEETTESVAIYNKLVREGEVVGGLFHSTC